MEKIEYNVVAALISCLYCDINIIVYKSQNEKLRDYSLDVEFYSEISRDYPPEKE